MTIESDTQHTTRGEATSTAALSVAGLAALMSASCCVLPIGLSLIGLGGSWLAMLGPLVAYRTPILVAVGIVLALAWIRIVMRLRRGTVRRSTLAVAAVASALFAAALSAPMWEQDAVQALLQQR